MCAPTLDTAQNFAVRVQPGPFGHVTVRVIGEVDLATAPVLEAILAQQTSRTRPRVTVDLHGVSFLDCTGLSALVTAHSCCLRREGTLTVIGGRPQLRRMLAIVGMEDLLRS